MVSNGSYIGRSLMGPLARMIKQKLENVFQPFHLEVICESYMHNVPKNSEKHFKVLIVSEKFSGLRPIERHRLVNEALDEELKGPIHALRIEAYAPNQYTGQKPTESPPCLGGGQK